MMDIADFAANGDCAYVAGKIRRAPPRYAAFRAKSPSGWTWTNELTEAETFQTKEAVERHMREDMAGLVDGNEDVKVLKVQMKVGLA